MSPEKTAEDRSERNTEDVSFVKIALKKGYVTDEQAEAAFAEQQGIEEKGLGRKPLADILLAEGSLDAGRVKDVYEIQGKEEGFPRIKGYRIESKIGAGGMGTVYRARQESLDRTVAIKVLDPVLSRDRKFISRFLREARLVARLNHENIIVGIDVGKTRSGTYFFVMEYVEGVTVYDMLQKDGPLPERRSLEICRQIASALDHATRQSLVHRDIKPDNILITPKGVAKLCDLGLAKSTFPDHRLTQAGSTHGTPHYMSPEQARGQENLDIRSDIYSLGATLYHMLTGDVPFDGASAAVILLKHISEEAPSIRRLKPGISEASQDLIRRMMAKKPEHRHQTPEELASDIDRILEGGRPAAWKVPDSQAAVQDIDASLTAQPRIGSEAATQLYSREFAAVKRDPYVYLAYATAAAVLAACLVASAGGISRSLGAAGRPGTQAGGDGETPPPGPPQPDPAKVREEKAARENLEYALGWISSHPGDPEQQISRLMESVVWRYAGTLAAQKAKDKAAAICAGVDLKAREAAKGFEKELGFLVGKKDYGGIIRKLDKITEKFSYIDRFGLGASVPALRELQVRRASFEADARKERAGLEARAAESEAAGKFEEAAQFLESVKDLGIPPDPADRIRQLRRKAEQASGESERRESFRVGRKYMLGLLAPLLDETKARNYGKAAERCRAAATDPDFAPIREKIEVCGRAVDAAGSVWSRAIEELDRLKAGSAAVLILVRDPKAPDGARPVRGFAKPAAKDSVAIFSSTGSDGFFLEEVHYADLATSEVLGRAGLDGPGKSGSDFMSRGSFRAFESEFDAALREMDSASRLGENADALKALVADLKASVDEAGCAALYAAALERYAASQWKEASAAFSEIKDKYSSTSFFREYEEEFTRMFRDANRRLVSRPDVSGIFRGEYSALAGDAFQFNYDFRKILKDDIQVLSADFRSRGRGAWKPEGNGLSVSGPGMEWIGRMSGDFEVEARIRIDYVTASAEFMSVEFEGVPEACVFSLNAGGGANRITARSLNPHGGEDRVLAEDRTVEPLVAGREYLLTAALRGEEISLGVDGRHSCTARIRTGGMAGVSFKGLPHAVGFVQIRVKCKLEPEWVLRHNR